MIRRTGLFSLIAAVLALSSHGLMAQAVDLPEMPAPRSGVAFHLDASVRAPDPSPGAPRWTVLGLKRVYYREDLPALFTRSLALDHGVPTGTTLSWIFTGDQGGITVELSSDAITVRQRYYDSIGLSSQRPPKETYPQTIWSEDKVQFRGEAHLVTVLLDSKLALLVSVNGKQLVKQTCLLEVRRQQIAWEPAAGDKTSIFGGRMIAPPAVEATISVHPLKKYQRILGFGGSVSVPAYAELSEEGKQRWWRLVSEYNLLVQREYPTGQHLKPDLSNFDHLEDASAHYYGDNFPNGEVSDFQYLRHIHSLGGKSIFEFWQLPPWVAQSATGSDGKPIENVNIREYVRAVVGYCEKAQKASGFAPNIVGVQNEIVQAPDTWKEMILRLREGLDLAGFKTVKIQMPDATSLAVGTATATTIAGLPGVWKDIDYAASHVYDFQSFFEDPDGYDEVMHKYRDSIGSKPFLATEFAVNRPAYQSGSYGVAFAMAQLYHKTMTILDAEALLYCWTLLDVEEPTFGGSRSLFIPDRDNGNIPKPSSYQLRTYGSFSRRLRAGMVRVDADSGDPGLLVSAYEGPSSARTVIVLNRSTVPYRIHLDWPGGPFTVIEVSSPYAANAVKRPSTNELAIQPGEIVTLSNVPLHP
jgi:O-glycosyl hydrolase